MASVGTQPQIGLPHLVYLTDEGIFSSVSVIKNSSESPEGDKGFFAICCCLSFWPNMRVKRSKHVTTHVKQVSG